MALIKCPDCGREVSDRTTSCIGCGCPLQMEKRGLIIKAQQYPDPPNTTYRPHREIGIFLTNGREIASLYSGSSTTIDVNEELEIYAALKGMIAVKPSNSVIVKPNKITRLMISYKLSLFSTKLILSEVDSVVSE